MLDVVLIILMVMPHGPLPSCIDCRQLADNMQNIIFKPATVSFM